MNGWYLVMLCLAHVVKAENVFVEPGVYIIKSVDYGKYLAFRSQYRGLEEIAFGSSVGGAVSGALIGAEAFGTLAATLAVAAAATGGAAVAGVALAIPLQRMLRSNALVLSSKRVLRWELEPSDATTNAFTLKVQDFPGDLQSGCYLNLKNLKKKNRVKLNADTGMSFVVEESDDQSVYLKALERDGEKWLVGGFKKVKLSSEKKTKWILIKQDPLHQVD